LTDDDPGECDKNDKKNPRRPSEVRRQGDDGRSRPAWGGQFAGESMSPRVHGTWGAVVFLPKSNFTSGGRSELGVALK